MLWLNDRLLCGQWLFSLHLWFHILIKQMFILAFVTNTLKLPCSLILPFFPHVIGAHHSLAEATESDNRYQHFFWINSTWQILQCVSYYYYYYSYGAIISWSSWSWTRFDYPSRVRKLCSAFFRFLFSLSIYR